uniref:Uncharacterized protein n=1 Tax=Lepeophtheirus salmonis TaxID=72036 RepID=A0A0K2T6D9_LEPSM
MALDVNVSRFNELRCIKEDEGILFTNQKVPFLTAKMMKKHLDRAKLFLNQALDLSNHQI